MYNIFCKSGQLARITFDNLAQDQNLQTILKNAFAAFLPIWLRASNAPAVKSSQKMEPRTLIARSPDIDTLMKLQPHLLLLTMLAVQAAPADAVTVMNNNDSGAGSLRQALSSALPGETISFDPAVISPIILTSDELHVDGVNIVGPGANKLTISGNLAYRVLDISGTASISGLTIDSGSGGLVSRPDGLVGLGGGGIACALGSTVVVSNCAFSGNHVLYYDDAAGGAIYNLGTLTVNSSTFSSNSVTGFGHYNTGGAIYNIGVLALTNCTFFGNSVTNTGSAAATTGGAVYNDTYGYMGAPVSGFLYVMSCTFSGNYITNSSYALPYGGAIDNTGHAPVGWTTLQNTIVAGNRVNGGVDVVIGMHSQGYNFIGAGVVDGTWLASDQVGTAGAPKDPIIATLRNNGGTTFTMSPSYKSLVVNQGNSGGLTTDQRGYARPYPYPNIANAAGGDGSDIGAVELYQPPVGYNGALLLYPNYYPGFLVETSSSITLPIWRPMPGPPPEIVGDYYVVSTGPATNSNEFFRLALGNAGSAIGFDGVAAYLSVGASPLPPPWTAEFWVNRLDAPGYSATLLGDSVTALKLEQFNFTRQVGLTKFGVADYTFNYSAPTNTWVHLAFVCDTTTRLYVNGVLQDTLMVTNSLPLGRIGFDSSGYPDYLHGTLDEVRVWNVARTQAQIQAGMFNILTAPPSTLVGYWKFDEGGGSTTLDSSGQGKTGILTGTATWVNSTAPILP